MRRAGLSASAELLVSLVFYGDSPAERNLTLVLPYFCYWVVQYYIGLPPAFERTLTNAIIVVVVINPVRPKTMLFQ